ncbi:putative metallopeptidase [Pseudohongiella sp. O18]|uniref:putative metallopeptidase n=1 Tax=Pseudohongiella sp. O18 TaxID=2904248 RepID=UPI001F312166|nr:putative metallopeptidase [Pseudohongiella sp. O18]
MSDLVHRPVPPETLFDTSKYFVPAPEVWHWVCDQIISEQGQLYNPDHAHLEHAQIGFLWAAVDNSRKGRKVLGMAEELQFRCGKWQKARQEMQMHEWFGDILPDFVITLDARYCDSCADADFCALVEHELYHCAQQRDPFGAPKFSRTTGRPMFELKGHDVEEFVGVVRRYGAISPDGKLQELVEAANSKPEVSRANISAACGTCQMKLAS